MANPFKVFKIILQSVLIGRGEISFLEKDEKGKSKKYMLTGGLGYLPTSITDPGFLFGVASCVYF